MVSWVAYIFLVCSFLSVATRQVLLRLGKTVNFFLIKRRNLPMLTNFGGFQDAWNFYLRSSLTNAMRNIDESPDFTTFIENSFYYKFFCQKWTVSSDLRVATKCFWKIGNLWLVPMPLFVITKDTWLGTLKVFNWALLLTRSKDQPQLNHEMNFINFICSYSDY